MNNELYLSNYILYFHIPILPSELEFFKALMPYFILTSADSSKDSTHDTSNEDNGESCRDGKF